MINLYTDMILNNYLKGLNAHIVRKKFCNLCCALAIKPMGDFYERRVHEICNLLIDDVTEWFFSYGMFLHQSSIA